MIRADDFTSSNKLGTHGVQIWRARSKVQNLCMHTSRFLISFMRLELTARTDYDAISGSQHCSTSRQSNVLKHNNSPDNPRENSKGYSVCVCVYIYIYYMYKSCVCVCARVFVRISVYMHMYIRICTISFMCVCVHVCMGICSKVRSTEYTHDIHVSAVCWLSI